MVFDVDEGGNVDADGTVTGNGCQIVREGTVKPTCNSSVSCMLWFTDNSPGKDMLEVCADDGVVGYGWQQLY